MNIQLSICDCRCQQAAPDCTADEITRSSNVLQPEMVEMLISLYFLGCRFLTMKSFITRRVWGVFGIIKLILCEPSGHTHWLNHAYISQYCEMAKIILKKDFKKKLYISTIVNDTIFTCPVDEPIPPRATISTGMSGRKQREQYRAVCYLPTTHTHTLLCLGKTGKLFRIWTIKLTVIHE